MGQREVGVPRDADVGQRALYCEERIQSRRTKRPPYLERCNLWPRRVHRPDARNTNAVRRLRCALLALPGKEVRGVVQDTHQHTKDYDSWFPAAQKDWTVFKRPEQLLPLYVVQLR